ncbi:MAG TPA: DUF3592 domain-containing protein [Candidatus Sulfotelmatobacter sp.]|nr:DUF3592 domain-containing protein [Candidatus Sulfotelmatobacter sp.]
MPQMRGWAITSLFAAAALNLAVGVFNYRKHRIRTGWLRATGNVESSNLRNDQKDSYLLEMLQREAMVAEVAYSYPVCGSYYSGYDNVVFRDEEGALNYVNQHQKGNCICVYYDPWHPERSMIEPGAGSALKYSLAGIAFFLLGLLVLLVDGKGR